ncbi:uncharacterized protein [Drosophila takahashii]|uniref:uncharacterized protein isoform X3 n=1 Tax=Drosophila takahashii TaxID=29030 RepID=UPI0038992BC3
MIILNRCSPIRQILRRCHRQAVENSSNKINLIAYLGKWPELEQQEFRNHMRIITDFISDPEEQQLHEEIEPYMSRLRYEFDHWDDVGHPRFPGDRAQEVVPQKSGNPGARAPSSLRWGRDALRSHPGSSARWRY